MSPAHLVEGCQPEDSDAASRFLEKVRAFAKVPRKSGDSCFATRAANSEEQLCHLARFFLFEMTLLFSPPPVGAPPIV